MRWLICVVSMLFLGAGLRGDTRPTTAPADSVAIAPALDHPLEPGQTVLWCASLQVVWDELAAQRPRVQALAALSPEAAALAMSRFPRDWIGEDDLVVATGLLSGGLVRRIEGEIKRKFGDAADAQLLPALRAMPRESSVAYAYLQKRLRFATPFKLDTGYFGWPARASQGPWDEVELAAIYEVQSFGIDFQDPTDPAQAAAAEQVEIVWVDDEAEDCVVELRTTAAGERLILSRLAPPATLREAIRTSLERMRAPNTSDAAFNHYVIANGYVEGVMEKLGISQRWLWGLLLFEDPTVAIQLDIQHRRLLPRESLSVPMLAVDRTVQFPSLADAAGLDWVGQRIKFGLNEKGAELASEVIGGLFAGPPRNFGFDRPFLVMLIREDAGWPYFAAWVGSADLMEVIETIDLNEDDNAGSTGGSIFERRPDEREEEP